MSTLHKVYRHPAGATHEREYECQTWRPTDRPVIGWCRQCAKRSTSPAGFASEHDQRKFSCGLCHVRNTLVWAWDGPMHAVPDGVSIILPPEPPRTIPHCGDVNCVGLCTDPECIPVENKTEIQLSQRVQKLEQMCVEKSDALIRMTSLRNYIFAALIVSLLTQLSLIAKFMAQ